MITTIVLVSLAYYWLLLESNFLRINLCQSGYDLDFDSERPDEDYDYYNSEDFIEAMNDLDEFIIKEAAYLKWLEYPVVARWTFRPTPKQRAAAHKYDDYPQYRWMDLEEKRRARRNGEMIYQRGR